ncbi:MAG: PH domain-containing protein [Stenotrophobium sp.]
MITNSGETTLWKGHPSQWTRFPAYCFAVLLTPLFGIGLIYALAVYLQTVMTRYELTSQRLRLRHGVLNKVMHEVELYRVIDSPLLAEPFWLRLCGLGNVSIYSSDHTIPQVSLSGIREADKVRELVRNAVETVRDLKRVRMVNLESN